MKHYSEGRNTFIRLVVLISRNCNVVDFFVRILRWFPLNTFIRVMGLSTRGRVVLSAQNEVNEIEHRE